MSAMDDIQRAESGLPQRNALNEIDFCMAPRDTVLSGLSLTKLLNSLTNEVFKAIVIGDVHMTQELLRDWDAYASQLQTLTSTTTRTDQADGMSCESALSYFTLLKELILERESEPSVMLRAPYEQAYKRLLTMLRDAGCRIEPGQRMSPPADKNLCLSIFDLSTAATTRTKTRILNQVSNVVTRALLYGSSEDRARLAGKMQERKIEFERDWVQGPGSQEALYYNALVALLREGPVAVSKCSIDISGPPLSFPVTTTSARERPNPIEGRLLDAWSNAYERVIENIVNEMGSRTSMMVSDETLSSFIAWERSVRRNMTDQLWKSNPSELTGDWIVVDMFNQQRARDYASNPLVNLNEAFLGDKTRVTVRFTLEGAVSVPASAGRGLRWRFLPGPAHLDTCEFQIVSASSSKMLLTYTGYIDRGQRIESRFSGRPIRMIGRVVSSDRDGGARGEGGTPFVMELRRQ